MPRQRRQPLIAAASLALLAATGCRSTPPAAADAGGPPAGGASGKPAAFDEEPRLLTQLLRGQEEDRGAVIRQAFDRSDADRRQDAVRRIAAAGWGGQPEVLPLYRLLLTDPDSTVRAAAVSALARHGGPGDADVVAAQLAQPAPFLRWEAAKALRRLPGEATVPPLLDALLEDEDAGTRVAAAEALGRYRRRDVYEALRRALLDADFAVVAAAAESLATLTGEDLGSAPEPWRTLAEQKGANLFADARPYVPRDYREPPGFFGRLLGR